MRAVLRAVARGEVKAAMRVVAFGWWWADRALRRCGEKSETIFSEGDK